MITVGVVHHGRPGATPLEPDSCLEVRTRVNAGPNGEPWLGFAANHNRLMEGLDSGWYVALNPDVEVQTAQIQTLVEAAKQARVSICAPLLASPWGIAGKPQIDFLARGRG